MACTVRRRQQRAKSGDKKLPRREEGVQSTDQLKKRMWCVCGCGSQGGREEKVDDSQWPRSISLSLSLSLSHAPHFQVPSLLPSFSFSFPFPLPLSSSPLGPFPSPFFILFLYSVICFLVLNSIFSKGNPRIGFCSSSPRVGLFSVISAHRRWRCRPRSSCLSRTPKMTSGILTHRVLSL